MMYRSPFHSLLMYQFIVSFLSDLGESKGKKGTQRGVSQGAPVPIWCPTPEGHFKVNMDGAVAKTSNRGAVGAVCRSHDGDYLGASAVAFEGITHPGCLKAMACREALALLADGWRGSGCHGFFGCA
jgi:hypothetical protein